MGRLNDLKNKRKSDLVNLVYNNWIANNADWPTEGKEPFGHGGKKIPYIGWFWRDTNLSEKIINIGDCGQFIGVMGNNKWNYPERRMTKDEVDKFILLLDVAYAESRKGGCLSDINRDTDKAISKIWDWMQTLSI